MGHCILHVCGGDPAATSAFGAVKGYSPRMWRWSSIIRGNNLIIPVFSTYVEVIPIQLFSSNVANCILHVCGGDPWVCVTLPVLSIVFSTYVEVIPYGRKRDEALYSILHVCGGDPAERISISTTNRYSPRMWRWSHLLRSAVSVYLVFSTYVEVILLTRHLGVLR